MRRVSIFDEHAQEYDRWFEENTSLYQAEVSALRRFIPATGTGVEIGVGTGRFAAPLAIKIGIEPSRRMAEIARGRGIAVCQAVGEQMPFRDAQFDYALLITVICFVGDVLLLLRETRRVLKAEGRVIIGFIDKGSALGKLYESRKEASKFYREARFYSAAEVGTLTEQAGFHRIEFCQTVFGLPGDTSKMEPFRNGYGEGAFVVLSAVKNVDYRLTSPVQRGTLFV